MAVFFEPIKGWLARIGARKFGDSYTASAVVLESGEVKGFAGRASVTDIRETLRSAKAELGVTPYWERIRDMYKVKIEVSSEKKGVLTVLEQNIYDYAELLEYQRAITEGIFELGRKTAQSKK